MVLDLHDVVACGVGHIDVVAANGETVRVGVRALAVRVVLALERTGIADGAHRGATVESEQLAGLRGDARGEREPGSHTASGCDAVEPVALERECVDAHDVALGRGDRQQSRLHLGRVAVPVTRHRAGEAGADVDALRNVETGVAACTCFGDVYGAPSDRDLPGIVEPVDDDLDAPNAVVAVPTVVALVVVVAGVVIGVLR